MQLALSRRHLLQRIGMGFGSLALADLLHCRAGATPTNPLAPRAGHFQGKARRVVHLFMNGGASPMDTFDHKPELAKRHGQVFDPGGGRP